MNGPHQHQDVDRRLALAVRSIVAGHPFFGTLALFACYEVNDTVARAATDGMTIWFSPAFVEQISQKQLEGVLVHELLHCALDHFGRRGKRDPRLWNISADIVVNRMIRALGKYALPAGSVEERYAEERSVERVYEDLERYFVENHDLRLVDLPDLASLPKSQAIVGYHDRYWRSALDQALVIARQKDPQFGMGSWAGWRELSQVTSPQLSWREMLWRFVVRTPSDFSGFDRRFVWRGLYLDEMASESLNIAVAIDTSASISGVELGSFMSEIVGIISAYPHLKGVLYFADAGIHGPHAIVEEVLTMKPVGGGGTSFIPFFEALKNLAEPINLHVYFTDGYGSFPAAIPSASTIWVVPSGGASSESFPFGEVVRMTYA